jgi:beta-lactam-binding protein with PASTA domain
LVEGDAIAVPELTGKTVREVTEICQRLGMNPVLVGTGVVMRQEPQAGTAVPRGGSVTVRFGRTPPPSLVESRVRRLSRRRVSTIGIGGGR